MQLYKDFSNIIFFFFFFFFLQNTLYFKYTPRKQSELLIIDAETLTVTEIAVLEGRDWSSSVMFSDGECLGMITAGKDVSFFFIFESSIKFMNIDKIYVG